MVSIEITGETAEDVVSVVSSIFGARYPKDARQVARETAKLATVGLSVGDKSRELADAAKLGLSIGLKHSSTDHSTIDGTS